MYFEDDSWCLVVIHFPQSYGPVFRELGTTVWRLLVIYFENQRFDMWRMAPDVRLLKIMKLFSAYLEKNFCRLLVLYLENQRFDMWRMAPGVRPLKIMRLFPAIHHPVLSFL